MNYVKRNWYISISLVVSIISVIAFNITKDFTFQDLTMKWNIGHYAVNYIDFGFLKRGLIGSFYTLINGSFSQESLFLFQFSFLILIICTTHLLFTKLELNKSFVYVLFILSPATFMQFSSDFGRFDPILVAMFMLSVIYRSNSVLFVTFSILGILTHEIYIFAMLPASFILFLFERFKLHSLKEILVKVMVNNVFYLLMAAILIIVLQGSYELGHKEIINTFLKCNIPTSYVNSNSGGLHIWTRSISDNLELTSNKFSLINSTIFVMITYPVMIIYFNLIGVSFKNPKYYLILLSSSPMFFLGTDWARWLAFIYISIFVVFITTEKNKAMKISNKYFLIFSLYGPIGVSGTPVIVSKIFALYQLM